jgi:hypothetical protein
MMRVIPLTDTMMDVRPIFLGLLVSLSLAAAPALGADLPIKDAACVPVLNNGNHCTSNALAIKAVSLEPARNHCNLGETFDLNVGITFGSGRSRSAAQRYNIGVWIGENGEPAIGGAQCTFNGLQPATNNNALLNLTGGSGPFRLINNDSCGDILDTEQTYLEFQANEVLCQDKNGNGKLDIPLVVAWQNNANKGLCVSPTDVNSHFPSQSSACREFESYDLDIITVEPPAEIEVYKTPTPRFIRGTSGLITFEVEVFNESDRTDDLVITALIDDQFGDLADQGNCATGGRLAPGARYRCEFQKTLTGTPGGAHENTVTATATDSAGQSVSDTDSARVLFLADTNPPQPDIRVIKTASPHSLNEPGGPVVYQVEVWNDGETNLNLTALDDSRTGGNGSLNDLGSCTLPQFIAKGLSYSCDYTLQVSGRFPGSDTNTVTATAAATATGTVVTDTETASVAFRDTPVVIRMKKLPRTAVIQARTNVVYEVIIENHSPAKSVTITSLVDNYHGDLSTLGLDCGDTPVTNPLSLTLAADGFSIECTFTGTVPETTEALPTDVAYYPDTVTASGTADDGTAVSAIATAEVQFIPGGSGVAPSPLIEVSKVARPDRVPTTGGAVAFTAEVINASATEAVLIEELVDDIHGNLSGRGNCGVISTASPLEIAAGATHRCTFTEQLKGAEGSIERDTITAYGKGKVSGEAVLGFDDAAVKFTGVPLDIAVSKTPSENSTDPGAVVTFTINISNNNDFSVDINTISDSVFGDLNGTGDCAVPMRLASQSSKACTFQKAVYPNIRPRIHNNVVTISAQPAATQRSDSNFVSASDQAWIAFTRALPGASLPVPASPHGLLLVFCSLVMLWLGRRRWQSKVTANPQV